MHEFSVVRGLLKQMEQLAQQHEAAQITSVALSVGEFSGVDADLLQLAFEQLAPDSTARRATLSIQRVPLRARCRRCELEFDVQNFRFVCPECRDVDVTIVAGDGLVLESITCEADTSFGPRAEQSESAHNGRGMPNSAHDAHNKAR